MAHIDWLTIVGRRESGDSQWTVAATYIEAAQWYEDESALFKEAVGSAHEWQIVKPRAPYSYAKRSEDASRTLYVHPLANHFTLEITGSHCQKIAASIPELLNAFWPYVSRLDIAVDMETTVTPKQFYEACYAPQIKTHSILESATGQTVYTGSRSSERFARIYRYNHPHPRAHLLRAEFQLKGEYAIAAAQAIADGTSVDSLAAGLGQHFGFKHPCWNDRDIAPTKLKVPSHAQSGNTVFWLTSTVAPLLKRLEREGKLDVKAWMETYVMDE